MKDTGNILLKSNNRIVAALWFWMFVNYLDRVAISFAGPAIMQSLSMTATSFGVILSSFSIGYMLAQIPGGLLSDRWGARIVMVAGALFWAFFTGLTGIVSTIAGFVVVRGLFGIAEGLSTPSLHRVIGDEFEPQQRARVFGIIFTGLALGPLVAGPIVGALVHAHGWRWMFLLLVIPALLAALGNYLSLPRYRAQAPHGCDTPVLEEQRGRGFQSLTTTMRSMSFWTFSIFSFCYTMSFWGYLGWMPNYLAMERHIAVASLGFWAGVPYFFAIIGQLLGGWLGTGLLHRHRAPLIGSFLLCAGISLYIAYQAKDLLQSVAALCSTAFFLYGCQPSIGAVTQDLAPERFRATYYAITSTLGEFGGIVAPLAVGYLVTESGAFSSGFGLLVLALCVAAGCILSLTPTLRKRQRVKLEKFVITAA